MAIPQRYGPEYILQWPVTTYYKTADEIQIATVAVVLVSDRFLVAHAFLKDSAVHVKACTLTAAGKEIRSCVDDALRRAGVEAGQIQLVEAQGFTPTAEKNGLLRGIDTKQVSKPPAVLKDLSTTGLASLCEIGELSRYKVVPESCADMLLCSLAATRLDS